MHNNSQLVGYCFLYRFSLLNIAIRSNFKQLSIADEEFHFYNNNTSFGPLIFALSIKAASVCK